MVDTYVSGAYGFSVWVQVPSPTNKKESSLEGSFLFVGKEGTKNPKAKLFADSAGAS